MRSSVVGQNKGRNRDENAIEGANGPIYIVNRDDVGFKIFAEVRVFHVRSEGNPSGRWEWRRWTTWLPL